MDRCPQQGHAARRRRQRHHVVNREAAESEVQAWVGVMAQGSSRQAVTTGFVISTERLATVVGGYYTDLLGRGIDGSGLLGWVSAIQNGTRTELVIGGIIASDEYFAKSQLPR